MYIRKRNPTHIATEGDTPTDGDVTSKASPNPNNIKAGNLNSLFGNHTVRISKNIKNPFHK